MASLPDSAYCGDTIVFSASIDTGSTGKVIFRHVDTGKSIEIEPTISGGTWSVSVAPVETAEAESGQYLVRAITDLAGVRETVAIGKIRLLPPADRPPRSTHIRKMVGLLEAHLENRLDDNEGRGLESYTIGGVPITKIAIPEAVKLLDHYKRALQTEVDKERAEQGLPSNRIFNATFQ
jgi:hypothetical protein